jgi:CRP-like cAMP-binding protein
VNPNIDARAVAVPPGNSVNNQTAELVRCFPLFSAMPLEECAKIIALAQLRNFERGKTIFFEGDPIRQVVLLTSGYVKLSQLGAQGQEVILRIIGPGEILCFQYFPKLSHSSTATAIERSVALVWEAQQFESAVERFPILRRNVSCVILQTLNQLEVRFREVSTEKVASRLGSQLLRLIGHVGKESDGYIEVALSQRDLAQLTGTTLFTVSRLLSQWKDQGIVIHGRESIRVLNAPALTEISQGE